MLPLPSALCAKAMSDRVPPSPSLSARSRIKTYLTVTTRISAQMINDKIPRMISGLAVTVVPDANTASLIA